MRPATLTRNEIAQRILRLPSNARAIAADAALTAYGPQPVDYDIEPLTQYQADPVGFMVHEMGIVEETLRWSMYPEYADHEWDGTVDPLVLAAESLAQGLDVGIEAGTGVGKTFLLAMLLYWWIASWENSIVPTTAPKEDQLTLHLWKEVGSRWSKFKDMFPHATFLPSGKLRMRPAVGEIERWAATGFVAGVRAEEKSTTKAQGFHGPDMLWIVEETPGMAVPTLTAIDETSVSDHNLQIRVGNPDHVFDPLHEWCTRPDVVHIRISALDHPNFVLGRDVIPGAPSRAKTLRRIAHLGEGSRLYNSRIRGISPTESAEALIKHEWCVRAASHYDDPAFRVGSSAIGFDVANSEAGDKAAVARWEGACLTEVPAFPCPDANLLGAQIAREAKDRGIDPKRVCGDAGGVGAGAINEGKRLGVRFYAFHASGKGYAYADLDAEYGRPQDRSELDAAPGKRPKARVSLNGHDSETDAAHVVAEERFLNKRAAACWLMREDLRLDRVALPPDPELFRDLCAFEYKTVNGVIVVLAKEKMKDILPGGRSPDRGEACILGNYVRNRLPEKVREPELPKRDYDRRFERVIRQLNRAQLMQDRGY